MTQKFIVAAQNGDVEEIKFLLSHNVDVNFKEDTTGITALCYAIRWYSSPYFSRGNSHVETIQILIKAKADLNLIYRNFSNDTTLLYYAVKENCANIVEMLLEANAKIHLPEVHDIDLLHLAIENNNPTIVKLLINAGADVNRKYSDGQTPLHRAAYRGLTEIIELLLLAGAEHDIAGRDLIGTEGLTPLLEAVRGSWFVYPRGRGIRGPEDRANWGDNIKALELLLKAGADITVQDNESRTPLHHAATAGVPDPAIAELLLKNGAIVDQLTKAGKSAADLANERSLMLKPKKFIDMLEAAGQLLIAAKTGNTAALDSILKRLGGFFNGRSIQNHNTALHFALECGKVDIALHLLRAGADINIRNAKGITASDLMKTSSHPHIKNLGHLNHAIMNLNNIKFMVSASIVSNPVFSTETTLAEFEHLSLEAQEVQESASSIQKLRRDDSIQKLRIETGLRPQNHSNQLKQLRQLSQAKLELNAKRLRESIKQAGFAMILEQIQPFINQIFETVTTLTDAAWNKERNYICYHLGMLLSGKFIQDFVQKMPEIEAQQCSQQASYFYHYLRQHIADIKEEQLKSDSLTPIDGVQAYNFLSLVSQEIGQKQHYMVQTMLFMLLFERNVQYLMKHPKYPVGPFIAIPQEHAMELIQLKRSEPMMKELELSVDEISHLLFDLNREQAILEHQILSGSENVHRAVLDKFVARRIDPTIEMSGIPGFKDFNHMPSLRAFFDKIDAIRRQDIALQEDTISKAKASSALDEKGLASKIAKLQNKIQEIASKLIKFGEMVPESFEASDIPSQLEAYSSDDETASKTPPVEIQISEGSDSRLMSLMPPYLSNLNPNHCPFSQGESDLIMTSETVKKPGTEGNPESSESLPTPDENPDHNKRAAEQYQALHTAIRNGKIDTVKRIVAENSKEGLAENCINLNQDDENGLTPLHLAVKQGNATIVAILLGAGASVNKENRDKETALHFAAKENHQIIIHILLSYGAILNHANAQGKIARQLAKDISLFKAAEDLFDSVEKDSTTHINEDILRTLAGALNARSHRNSDQLGDTALHIAIRKEKIDMIIRLNIANANFELRNSRYETPLDLMKISPQPYIRALANLVQIKQSPKSIESYQSNIDNINKILSEFTDEKYRQAKDYICYELGMRLARRTEEQSNYESLNPIDAIQAYNFLNKVSIHFGKKQFAIVQTILFLLIKYGHVNNLKKTELYPEGPFIAFKENTSQIDHSTIKALDEDEDDDEPDLNLSVESHPVQPYVSRSYETNRRLTMALYEHHLHSGPENPYKNQFVDAYIGYLID